MKNFIQRNYYYYVMLVSLILFFNQNVSAQYSRLTLDAKVGTKVLLGSVSPLPGANASLSTRYAVCRLLAVSAYAGTGVLWGNGGATRQMAPETGAAGQTYKEEFKFNTEYYTWGGNVYLNIQDLLHPWKKPKRIIPYIYAGAGQMRARSAAESMQNVNNTIRYATYFTSNVGIELKIKGSESIDYLVSVQQNFTQTPYLDGIPYDHKSDGFISVSAGVSYHLSSNNRKKTAIEWTRYNCCPLFNSYN